MNVWLGSIAMLRDFTYPVFCWLGMFTMMLIGYTLIRRGRRREDTAIMKTGAVQGIYGMVWAMILMIPWSNAIAARRAQRSIDRLEGNEAELAELTERAQRLTELSNKQAAFLGMVFFMAGAAMMLVIGMRAVNKTNNGIKGWAVTGVTELAAALGSLILGVICTAGYISAL